MAGTGGKPLAGACVVAAGPAGNAMAMTGRNGRYSISPLRPGQYTLHFSDCSAPGRYLDQWSGGGFVPTGAAQLSVAAAQVKNAGRAVLRSATAVLAGAGNQAGAIPGVSQTGRSNPAAAPAVRSARLGTSALAAGKGAIAGRVTGNGKPLKGICVVAYGRGRGRRVLSAASGRYRLGSLTPGRYFVAFYDCTRKTNWLGQYYRDAEFYSGHRPTRVPVTAGKTTRRINAHLELGGEIDGTVTNKAGHPLAQICAEAIGRAGRRFLFGGFARTALNGRYVMHALIPGTYQVHFARCGNRGNYAPVWWQHSLTLAHATKIVIRSGTVARHIDPVMPVGGVISGTVRAVGPHGNRLRGICVFTYGHGSYANAITGSDGSYRLIGLTTGKYRVFYNRCRNRGNYLPARRSVKVRIGHTVSGFDAFLPLGAIATGMVTDSHGNPVGGICVEFQGRRRFGGTRTRSDGSYSINAMRSGSYKVQFRGGCGNTGSYAPQFFHGQANIATASSVELTAGKTTGHIDAAMQPGATISGLVTDADGNNLRDVCVAVSPVSDARFGFFFRNIAFAFNGAYTATNLTPGLYVVNFGCFFGPRALAQQWFMAKSDASTANPVSAPAGVVTSGVSAKLQLSGSISGTVTNRKGTPLPRICVQAMVSGSSVVTRFFGPGFAETSKNGGYVLRGLGPGSYVIHYMDCGRRTYGSRWYKQKATPQSATPVTVTSGAITAGIDETLAPGGSISGLVKTTSGTALAGACVEAVDEATQSAGFAQADRTGRYTIKALSSGSYQLTFYPCRRVAPLLAASERPTPVAVTAPNAVTGINGSLGVAGSISGTVRDSAGGLQAGVCVVAVPADPGNVISYGATGRHGIYQIRGLGAGTYHVYFADVFCPSNGAGPGNAPQWYKNRPTQATATDVTVAAGATAAGVNAKLGSAGTITGTVTHLGQPVAGECVTAFPVSATPDPLLNETLQPVIAVSGSDGSYSLIDLLPGQYHVKFSIGCGDSGFATQWWQQATSEQSATTINVSANGTVTGIDASLP